MPILTREEQSIGDSAIRMLREAGECLRARRLRDGWPGFDHDMWQQMAEMGWLGLLVGEDDGGVGGTPRDMVVLLDHIGGSLPPEPLLQGIVAAQLLSQTESGREISEQLIAGEVVCAVAQRGNGLAAQVNGDAPETGTLLLVDAHAADLVIAYDASRSGISVLDRKALPASAFQETFDGGSLAIVSEALLSSGRLIASGVETLVSWRHAEDLIRLGLAAMLVGLVGEALDKTLEYMKLRKQFGAPIGSFQALQHRAASLHVAAASARALVYEATRAFGWPQQHAASLAAKARASETAMTVVKESVQFHGAIGFADEHDIGLYFRRAAALAAAWGNAAECRRLFIAERQLAGTMAV